jgi:hypothetical protein
MALSVPSAGVIEQGTEERLGQSAPRRWRVAGGVLLVAAGAAGAAVVGSDDGAESPPVAYVETWIEAWNARDSQTVSQMTCHYVGGFVAAGDIEDALDRLPPGEPPVIDHKVTGTESAVYQGREGVRVFVSYLPAAGHVVRDRSVFVRVRDDGDMCIGAFSAW